MRIWCAIVINSEADSMSQTRRILITGATGFVGTHLIGVLRREFPKADLLTDRFDITDAAAVHRAVRAASPDACIHLAGITALPAARRDPDQAWRVNLHGTLHLSDAVLAEAPNCRLLFVSSSEAYGRSFQSGTAIDEARPLAPMNTYAATKAASDLAIGARVADGLRAIRVRPFNHTGPGQTAQFVIPSFARQLARIAAGLQPPRMETGALDLQRDFLDVRDVCAAYAACLKLPDPLVAAGQILNLASGSPRRIGDILEQMRAIAGMEVEITTNTALLRPSEIPIAFGDSSRARRLLDWAPCIRWEQTLADVMEDWRQRIKSGEEA